MQSSPIASGVDRESLRAAYDARVDRESRADFLLREAASRMFDRLGYVKLDPVTRVLDVGCGRGDAAPLLTTRFASAHVIGVDLSLATLRAAAAEHAPPAPAWWQRTARSGPDWICGDAHRLPIAAAGIDLLWSNLVAHWFDDPPAVASEWRRVLRPGGLLMFSFFGVDTLREVVSATADPSGGGAVARLPRYPDLHDWGDILVHAGFAAPVMDVERLTLTYEDAAALARDAMAIRAGIGGTSPTMLPPAREVSIELVFGHAWRPLSERPARALSGGLDDAAPGRGADGENEPAPQPVRIVRRRDSPFGP